MRTTVLKYLPAVKCCLKFKQLTLFFLLLGTQAFSQIKDEKNVQQSDCNFGDFSLPNAFTPNGDGYNDEYCLKGWDNCVLNFSVLIFDRWGEKVFESGNPSFCWDGSFKGKIMETDVFLYTISASFTNGASISKQGNITLMR